MNPELPPVLPGRTNILDYERLHHSDRLSESILTFQGESVLVRNPFRWMLNGKVISNASESHDMEYVCGERGWKIEAKFGEHIAIISGATPANGLAGEEHKGENCGNPLNDDQTVGCSPECLLELIDKVRSKAPEQAAKPDEALEYHGGYMSPERAQQLESDLAAARAESEKWRFKFLTQRDESQSNTWVWMGDGEDHPESLACPVIMAPDQLREFVAAKEELSQANAANREYLVRVAKDAHHIAQLEQDNERLRSALEAIRDRDDAPSVDLCGDERVGVHCGVEDRGCSGRYEGADYGYQQGMERGLEWASNAATYALAPSSSGKGRDELHTEAESYRKTAMEVVRRARACYLNGVANGIDYAIGMLPSPLSFREGDAR